jgi:hypothetical protein
MSLSIIIGSLIRAYGRSIISAALPLIIVIVGLMGKSKVTSLIKNVNPLNKEINSAHSYVSRQIDNKYVLVALSAESAGLAMPIAENSSVAIDNSIVLLSIRPISIVLTQAPVSKP